MADNLATLTNEASEHIYWKLKFKPPPRNSRLRSAYVCSSSRVARNSAHCDLSIVVAFSHNELWQPLATNSFSVTSQVLWSFATMNCDS